MYYESPYKNSFQTGITDGQSYSVSHHISSVTAHAVIILIALVIVPVLSLLAVAR